MRKTKRDRYTATDFAGELASLYGMGRDFPSPVECWHVGPDNRIEKIEIMRVRGSCDYYNRSFDYADTTTGDSVSSRYLFPTRGYKRPRLTEMRDTFGTFHDWTSDKHK